MSRHFWLPQMYDYVLISVSYKLATMVSGI